VAVLLGVVTPVRAPTGCYDAANRQTGAVRPSVKDVVRCGGLHDHHGDVVSDEVVELPPDPSLLLGSGALGFEPAFSLEPIGLVRELPDDHAPGADAVAYEPCDGESEQPAQESEAIRPADAGPERQREQRQRSGPCCEGDTPLAPIGDGEERQADRERVVDAPTGDPRRPSQPPSLRA